MNRCVLRLEGEVDLSVRTRLEALLQSAVQSAVASDRDLWIDASQVTFMDSTGVGLIVQTSLAMGAAGHEVRLSGAPAMVRRVFEISGLGSLLVE